MKKTFLNVVLFLLSIALCCCSGCILDEIGTPSTAAPDLSGESTGKITVTFLDVGQGDAAFIELPNGKTMLVDAGPADAADTVVQVIQQKGYTKVDYLVATHPHADHIGGMRQVVHTFDIGEIYMPKAATNTKTYEKLLTEISDKGLRIKSAKAGMIICEGVEILAPNAVKYEELNNYSVVLRVTNGAHRFLLMGDAETLSETEILNAGFDPAADVVKVGHHGSGTSSGNDFVSAVHAKYAVFSVGKGNSYNHPHTFVVTKWQNAGANIYRTDETGTVTFQSDGSVLTVQTER